MTDHEMVDCGICGRFHQSKDLDCRAFESCPECGDGYVTEMLPAHTKQCNGNPSLNIVSMDEDDGGIDWQRIEDDRLYEKGERPSQKY